MCRGGELGSAASVQQLALLWFSWAAHMLIFIGFGASVAGLIGINVGALDAHVQSFGSGCTISAYNLLGYAMGPLLPGVIMDRIEASDTPIGSAELLCFGFGILQLGTLVALVSTLVAMVAARPSRATSEVGELQMVWRRWGQWGRNPLLASPS